MNPHPPSDAGFRFTTQRERNIYGRLQLIGDGPAANFADACRIMADGEGLRLQSATHIVGHLLREIESAVRDVLLAFTCHGDPDTTQAEADDLDTGSRNKLSGEDKHRQQIQQILRHYKIDESSGVGLFWLALTGKFKHAPSYVKPLHAIAHRNALARPRPLNSDFRRFWDDILGLLDYLLALFEASYATAIDMVDELLTHEYPTRENAKRLRETVPNSRVVLGYFFDRCQNPAWIDMLAAKGFFAHPPDKEIDEETGAALGYPIWPESRYLARMARLPTAQRGVEQAIRDLMDKDTINNVHVREDVVEVLSYLPVDRIADLAIKVAGWLESEAE